MHSASRCMLVRANKYFLEYKADGIYYGIDVPFWREKEENYMNKQESDILNALLSEPFVNQKNLAEVSGYSLWVISVHSRNLSKRAIWIIQSVLQ